MKPALRGAVLAAAAAVALPVAHTWTKHPPAPAERTVPASVSESDIPAMVREVAGRVPGFPVDLAFAIAERESHFNPRAVNLNTNGTHDWGVMQVNDVALAELGLRDPLDAKQNIEAGVAYLQRLWVMFEGDPPQLRREKVECVYAHGPRGCLPRLPGTREQE